MKELPGVVTLDIDIDSVFLLEALVHESAYHHLFIEEAASPLVHPRHHGTYHSPLRPEPRPLRGILLAYHALAYICAFYTDAHINGLVPTGSYSAEIHDTVSKLAEAESTLMANRQFLTDRGNEFIDKTTDVVECGRV
jgi:HEXXH motif-containing protein